MLIRHKAVEIAATQIGVHEKGGNNRGPMVRVYQAATDLGGTGWPWCAAFVSWCLAMAGFDVAQIHGRASVGFIESWGRKNGYLVTRPFKGDVFCWKLDSDNWPDHTGFVEKVLSLGPVMLLQTVEGNTSSGVSGSQDNGDGVYRRRRLVRRGTMTFVRVPGEVPVRKNKNKYFPGKKPGVKRTK